MCGIAGFITRNGHADAQRIPAVLQQLRHRGPDDHGYLLFGGGKVESQRTGALSIENPEVILLHRRLSIIDLSESGWQPMSSRDGRYHVVFNGEIYNYLELKEELTALGHRFFTQSDTEVLIVAFKQWGAEALRRFIGMFAFALLDTLDRTLFLARDFFGIKPLYFRVTGECLAFASELKVLAELSPGALQVNPERLLLYLRHGTGDYGTSTLFADIQQLPPAHYMSVSLDDFTGAQPVRYRKPSMGAIDISFDDAAGRIRELFLKNIRLHLRSDVPLGAALSGGIDSSSIVMAMRHVDSRAGHSRHQLRRR